MNRLVFCDVEGTLLTVSFPRLIIQIGIREGIIPPLNRVRSLTALGAGRLLPGKLGRALQMQSMLLAIAGCSEIEMERLLDIALPEIVMHLKPSMVDRLQGLQNEGYTLILVSAGLQPAIARLATWLGGRGEGTVVASRNGRYLARIVGVPCQGEGKAARVRALLDEYHADPADCIAFGDTGSDVPFLSIVGHPHAVDPDPVLATVANERGWPIIATTASIEQNSPSSTDAALDEAAREVLVRFSTPTRYPLREREQAMLQRGTPIVGLPDGLRATRWGEGPIVLLVHGWDGRGINLQAFIDPLVQSGYQVIALDAPAHGESAGTQTNPLEVARALLAVARVTGPLAGVIAHSMGAGATTMALEEGLPAARVVLIASPSSFLGVARRFVVAAHIPQPVADRFLDLLEQSYPQDRTDEDIVEGVRGLTTPALIIHDPEDNEVPYSEAESLHERWAGSRLLATEGRGHRRIILAPEVVAAAVAFLQESDVHDSMKSQEIVR